MKAEVKKYIKTEVTLKMNAEEARNNCNDFDAFDSKIKKGIKK